MIDVHRENAAVAVERKARMGDEIAALEIGEETFGTVAEPFHRALEGARRERDQDRLRLRIVAQPEAAADVGRNGANFFGRNAETVGDIGLQPHRALAAGERGDDPARLVESADRGARLELRIDDALGAERMLDHEVRAGESGVERRAIAQLLVHRDVRGRGVVEQRRAGRDGVAHVDDRRQRLVADGDALGRLARERGGLRHHHGDRLADVAHAVGGEHRLRHLEGGRSAPVVE